MFFWRSPAPDRSAAAPSRCWWDDETGPAESQRDAARGAAAPAAPLALELAAAATVAFGCGADDAELPIKDGEHDHWIDALRYFFVNHVGAPSGRTVDRPY